MNSRHDRDSKISPVKRIVLCADDFAQSAAVSAGIEQLVAQGRLSAVSCLSESEFWAQRDHALFQYRDRIDIGLHFNLTHPFAHSAIAAQPLNRVMGLALSGRIDRAQIARALHAQLDRFEAVANQMPDFVDGHQHVHVLPGIRAIVIKELTQRYGRKTPYLRAVNPRLATSSGWTKVLILKLLGSGFGDLAQRKGLRTNGGFGGIYSLQPHDNFAVLMDEWLASARHGDLFMCHPGTIANDNSDPIAATRPRELAFLCSAKFESLLSENAIQLSRFADIETR